MHRNSRAVLAIAQQNNDVLAAEELLRDVFATDTRALVAEAARQAGGAGDPIGVYRKLAIREQLIEKRGKKSMATGL